MRNEHGKGGYVMHTYRIPIAAFLLLAFCSVLFAPAAAMAASPLDLLGQNLSKDKDSSFNIWNLLLGLLLGKALGGGTGSSSQTSSPVSIKNLLPSLSKEPASVSTGGNNALIATAQNYMGVPYVWGGATPSGFDCSGFTQYVMAKNGITIPRTAAEQFAAGTPVDKKNLQVGDLVFFTTYKPGASHVGFYMGNNQFIHASSAAAKVTINSLDETYYAERYIGARHYKK